MRLIDAEHLKRWILARWEKTDPRSEYPLRAIDIIDQIDREDTIDAVLVKHGKWIHGREVSRDYVGDACVCIRYENWWCSECNYTIDSGEPLWHFCPNCGASMDGGKDDATND